MTFAEIMLIALTAFTAAGSFCFAAVMAVREIWGGSHCDEKSPGWQVCGGSCIQFDVCLRAADFAPPFFRIGVPEVSPPTFFISTDMIFFHVTYLFLSFY